DRARRLSLVASMIAVAFALVLTARVGLAQNTAAKPADSSASKDRWLHVRVESPDRKEESVRVNVPLELAEKILPTINHDRLQNGKVHVDKFDSQGVDIRALIEAVRTSKDGEFVTVQQHDCDVRVAKQNNYLLVHVFDKKHTAKNSRVEVKVPMSVVNALF